MAKRRARPRHGYAVVKIDAKVLADAKVAAQFFGMTVAEYVSERLAPIAAADIRGGYSKWQVERGGQKPPAPQDAS